jgi:hypothetical protein
MPSTALLSLVAKGSHEEIANIKPKYKSSNETINLYYDNNCYAISLNNECDSITINNLIIECVISCEMTDTYISNLLNKLDSFQILIGGTEILNNKIKLLTSLKKPRIVDNNIIVDLSFDMLLNFSKFH